MKPVLFTVTAFCLAAATAQAQTNVNAQVQANVNTAPVTTPARDALNALGTTARDTRDAAISAAAGAAATGGDALGAAQAAAKAQVQTATAARGSATFAGMRDRAALRAYQAQQLRAGGQAAAAQAAANRLVSTLPTGWQQQIVKGKPVPVALASAATRIQPTAVTGLGAKSEGSVVLVIRDRAILIDGNTSVVLDVMTL